jgi:hypothetical protein
MRPHNENTESWDERRWERALREGDGTAAKYFQLLRRFADLPAADELISDRMGPEFEDELPDCDFNCEECTSRWECEYSAPLDWDTAGEREEEDGEEDESVAEGPPEPGDSLFFETRPAFRSLRQVAMGWCNVYAVILPPECRSLGLKVLYYLGRALAYLSCSIGDGLYAQPARSVAFGKRALATINVSLGVMDQLIEKRPQLEKLLCAMRRHLLVARQAAVDHLQRCRRRLEGNG